MKKFLLTLAIFGMLSVVWGAEGKRAYIDMEKVFNEYYKTINENIVTEGHIKTFNDGFELLREEYQNSVKEFRKAETDAENELLSEETRATARGKAEMLAQRLQQKQQEIGEYRQKGGNEIQQKQQAMVEKLVEDLLNQVRKYAADHGYTEVLEISGRSTNRVPLVLVYPPEQEITDEVIKLTNAGHEKEKTEAQARLDELRKKMENEMKARRAAAAAQP